MNPDQTIITLLTEYQWPAIFIGAFLFGETVIIAAAFLAAGGLWTLTDVFWLSLAGTITSDSTWFLFGQKILPLFNRGKQQKERQQRILASVETATGGKPLALMLCAKFVYGTRILTIVYLSRLKLPYSSFAAFDTASSTIWLAVVCAIGWLTGKSMVNLAPYLNQFKYAALFLILIIVIFKIGTVWLSKKITNG